VRFLTCASHVRKLSWKVRERDSRVLACFIFGEPILHSSLFVRTFVIFHVLLCAIITSNYISVGLEVSSWVHTLDHDNQKQRLEVKTNLNVNLFVLLTTEDLYFYRQAHCFFFFLSSYFACMIRFIDI